MREHPANDAMGTGAVALSVIIPMFNEAERIGATAADVCATLEAWGERAEVLLVDDGSTDGTPEVAAQLCGKASGHAAVRVLAQGVNRGKGAAVRAGMLAARGAWVIFMDADNSTRLIELSKLREEAARSGALIVIGSREVVGSEVQATRWRRVAGRAYHACLTLLGLNLARDTQCGFKLYRADAAAFLAQHSTESGFAFDAEHLLLARRAGIPFREVGVRWTHHTGGSLRVVRDGLKMLHAAWRIRRRVKSVAAPFHASPAREVNAPPIGAMVELKPTRGPAQTDARAEGAHAG